MHPATVCPTARRLRDLSSHRCRRPCTTTSSPSLATPRSLCAAGFPQPFLPRRNHCHRRQRSRPHQHHFQRQQARKPRPRRAQRLRPGQHRPRLRRTVSNLEVLRFGISTFPLAAYTASRRLQVGTVSTSSIEQNANAPIDQATISGEKYLGWEPDFYVSGCRQRRNHRRAYSLFVPNSKAFASDSATVPHLGVTFAF